jgi:23S rRNA (cytidine1920-2'-O)/16S rRNA (cytidine1409-2'-O)-methyltransferase
LARRSRSPTIPILDALVARHPGLDDAAGAIRAGDVLVDGKPVLNPRARIPAAAALVVRSDRALRGSAKLEAALERFGVAVSGRIALDCGAAAGGFTRVLLDRGAARVYAVDAGFGQLRGELRQDPRVVNLERTNLGDLTPDLVPDAVDMVTFDLSYLSLTDAVGQLDRIRLADDADLVALVKPMFELALAEPPTDDDQALASAVATARVGITAAGWTAVGDMESPVRGARGAVEFLVHARR